MARITVEDCLRKEINRFSLVLLASKRTKQLVEGAQPLVRNQDNKSVVTSLREIADGSVRFMTDEEVAEQDERRMKREQIQKMFQASNADTPSAPVDGETTTTEEKGE